MKCVLVASSLVVTVTVLSQVADAQQLLLPTQRVSDIRESTPSARAREADVLRELLGRQDRQSNSPSRVASASSSTSSSRTTSRFSPKYQRVPYQTYPSQFYRSARSPYGWYRPGVPAPWAVFQLPEPPRLGSVYRGIKHPSQWPGR